MKPKNTVNIGFLKQQLSRCLQRVRRGERLIVMDRDTPVAEIVPIRGEAHHWQSELASQGLLILLPRRQHLTELKFTAVDYVGDPAAPLAQDREDRF